jgi:hypothetical protein
LRPRPAESGRAELITGAAKAGLRQGLRVVEESVAREKLTALTMLK